MKKVFLLALLALSTIGANAQKVIMDKVESDGNRHIQTKYTTIYTKLVSAGAVSLCCIASENDTIFGISLLLNEQKPEIDEGRKLLVKLGDGSVITLENVKKIGPLDYETRRVYNSVEYLVYPLYYASKEDVIQMINKGVTKLRIETDLENLDRDIKSSKMSDALRTGLANIEKALSVKKDLYSDF